MSLLLIALMPTFAVAAPSVILIPNCMTPKVARDGSGVVAQSSVNVPLSSKEIIRWTPGGGVERYPTPQLLRIVHSSATGGVAATGMITVGSVAGIGPHYQMFRWSIEDGFELLPHYFPTATARYQPGVISDDGRVIHGGQQGFPAVIVSPVTWIDGIAAVPLLPLPGSFTDGSAVTTNRQGNEVFGWLSRTGIFRTDAYFRWTEQAGMQVIPTPAGFGNAQITNASPESGIILGRGTNWLGDWQSFLIHPDGAVDPLPYLGAGIYDRFTAHYMTADADLILGDSFPFPLLWSEAMGFRDVMDYAQIDLGLDLEGWELDWEHGMSADGGVMTFELGRAYPHPDGASFGCGIINVPEPGRGAMTLAALGTVFVICSLRRSSKVRAYSSDQEAAVVRRR